MDNRTIARDYRDHPLYGVRGWLLAVLLLLLLRAALLTYDLLPTLQQLPAVFRLVQEGQFLGYLLLYQVVFYLLLLVALFLGFVTLSPAFRPLAILVLSMALVLRLWGVFQLAEQVSDGAWGTMLGQVLGLTLDSAVLLYLCLSRQVRVTYLRRVEASDPFLHGRG